MLLEVKDVRKSYTISKGIFKKSHQEVLKGVSFGIKAGECLGLIGESGSGKSTLGRLILGLEKPDSGEIYFAEKSMSIVFQDYVSSVNARLKVRDIIAEPLLPKRLSKNQMHTEIVNLLEKVGMDEKFINRFPHELSGGQLQRVCIAKAIANRPQFLVLDEAVSSLDMAVQVQVLDLLLELKQSEKLLYLFITHDILACTYICDRILFFKDGEVLERVDDMQKLNGVKSPYAKQLLGVCDDL